MSKLRDKRAEQYDNICDWKQLTPSTSTNNVSTTQLQNNELLLSINTQIKRKSVPLDILGKKKHFFIYVFFFIYKF